MLDNVTLVQLRTFATVARERNFTHAALALGYTPPAVHQQIGKLERALNVVLIKRDQAPMELTREGEQLLPAIIDVLSGLGELAQLARGVREDARVSVGGGRSTGVYVLPAILRAYAAAEPNAAVDYSVASAEELIEQVMAGDIDLAVSSRVSGLLERREAARRGLRMIPWMPVYGGLFRLATWTPGRETSIFVPPYSNLEATERRLAEHYPSLRQHRWRVTALPSTDAVRSALVNGLGLAYLPEDAVGREVRAGSVVCEGGLRHAGRAVLLHRNSKRLSLETRRLIHFIAARRRPADVPQEERSLASA